MLQQYKKFASWILAIFCCWITLSPIHSSAADNVSYVSVVHIDLNESKLQDSLFNAVYEAQDSSKSKIIAAILAFPYPFGMLGLHRIYLGTKPVIPIVYFVTFGGGVGILPFVDMIVILLSRDTKPFYKNPRILMWNKKKKKEKKKKKG